MVHLLVIYVVDTFIVAFKEGVMRFIWLALRNFDQLC
jgi:hypothetical protein